MLRSMTGFGRAEGVIKDSKVIVELRSLNSKQLDLFLKLPSRFKEREADLRQWASERIIRGKAELFVNCGTVPGVRKNLVNAELVRSYYRELKAISEAVAPAAQPDLLGLVLRLPDVMGEEPEPL